MYRPLVTGDAGIQSQSSVGRTTTTIRLVSRLLPTNDNVSLSSYERYQVKRKPGCRCPEDNLPDICSMHLYDGVLRECARSAVRAVQAQDWTEPKRIVHALRRLCWHC